MSKTKVLVIVGPTASGKSDLAVRLAQKFDGEVISADSRQVYTGLDVGTGKITKEEMQGIPHHLLDVADPRERFTVSDYKKLATKALQYIVTNSKLPIIVGGSGFYIDTLTSQTSLPDAPPNPTLRQELEKKSTPELFSILQDKDSERASSIDPHNKVRLVRALEIVEALGSVPQAISYKPEATSFIYIGLEPEKEILEKKILDRLIERLPGMIEEAKKLVKLEAISYSRMDELGLEYRYLAKLLQGELSEEEMVEQLNTAIRQYAKRQITWFKRNKDIKWFKPEEYEEIEKYLENQL